MAASASLRTDRVAAPAPNRRTALDALLRVRWPKANRLRRSADFSAVQAEGRAVHGSHVVCVARRQPGVRCRAGFRVSRKVGNAVTRNAVRRRLRACVQARYDRLPPGTEFILIARPSAAGVDFATLQADVARCLARLPGAAEP